MVFAITKYSPNDVDSLLSSYNRTLEANKKADFLYLFKFDSNESNSKITIVFNSYEYCSKRDLTILDANNENIVDIIKVLKSNIKE